ncbi:MAG TPA: hypothetical protein VNW51_03860 [Mucilaginibacter sp.]|jgi:hypothetical protein|nr:hypothetical protein [Mucilaginibacter sp.]
MELKNQIQQKFDSALPAGAGKLSPRNGYYFIRSISFRDIKKFNDVPVAQVNWKAAEHDSFAEDVIFEIALSSLYSSNPAATLGMQLEDLIGKTIQVYNTNVIVKDGKPEVNCTLQFINEEPTFYKAENLAIISFFGNAKTLAEACQNYIATAPYDVLEAEEWEASIPYIGEDLGDAFDAYDAPEDNDQ